MQNSDNSQQLVQEYYFPTPICYTRLVNYAEYNERLREFAYSLQSSDSAGIRRSNRNGGYHSHLKLHHEKSLAPFFQQINEVMSTMMEGMKLSRDYVANMTTAHINISPRQAFNAIHVHPNCHFSGVYYVQVPEKCGNISFKDPRPQKEMLELSYEEESPVNWKFVEYAPQEGVVFLFPAWLGHQVLPNRADLEGPAADRISVSFNYRLDLSG